MNIIGFNISSNVEDGVKIFFLTVVPTAVLGFIFRSLWNNRFNIIKLFSKLRLFLFPVNFNIALAIDSDQGLNTGLYYREIQKKINELILSNNLSDSIKVIDVSVLKKISSDDQAKKFREDKDIDLLIWGKFSDDRLKDAGESLTKISLSFTYGHPETLEKKIGPMLLADISSKMALKNYWKVIESNSANDVSIVADNIFQISMYILALTLKIYGRIEKSLDLFEKLFISLDAKDPSLQVRIIPHVVNCSELLATESYYKKNYIKSSMYLEKILSVFPYNRFALSGLAVSQYRLGNFKRSKELVELLLIHHAQIPSTELNIAFMRILEKNYKNALLHYKRLLYFDEIDFNAQEVIEFLGEEYGRYKDPALLFGSAVVSMKFGDPLIAISDFERYLEKSNQNTSCRAMYKCAERLLDQTRRKLR